jgi:centrosomal protein CEP41
MIIVYHKDERNSIPHAQLLVQKGFDNVYLLTGGIEEFVENYPEKCDGPGVNTLIAAKIEADKKKESSVF